MAAGPVRIRIGGHLLLSWKRRIGFEMGLGRVKMLYGVVVTSSAQ
jgi:hypothetical protein